jgi:peptidoglycan/LPS O-acetylase OafA/YrhL
MNLPKHMPALDGLRGVAILMVILAHAGDGPGVALPHWLGAFLNSAQLGVALFFIVSAFTLTVRAQRDHGGLRSYALRRLARVGPGYWLAGVAYTLVFGLSPRLFAPHGVGTADMIVAAVFGSAWQGGASLAVVPGGWSISCEIAFYIALPFLIRIIDGRIWRAIALTGLAIAVARLYTYYAMLGGADSFSVYVNPIGQAPVFLCGVTAALLAARARWRLVPGLAIALLALTIVTPSQLPFAFLAAAVVALSAVHPPWLLASRAARRIGEVSYSMYLIHFALLRTSFRMAEWLIPASDWRTMLLFFAVTASATFAIACLTYQFVELPVIRWAAGRPVSVGPKVVMAAD